jgi:hypothetical protein
MPVISNVSTPSSTTPNAGVLDPAADAHGALAAVECHRDLAAVALNEPAERRRVAQGHRADQHTVNALCEQGLHRGGGAQASADLENRPRWLAGRECGQDGDVWFRGRAGACCVEIDHVQRRGTRRPDQFGSRTSIVQLVGQQLVELPVQQAHGTAVDQVDGRIETKRVWSRCHRASMLTR